jgi:hypothetical protein
LVWRRPKPSEEERNEDSSALRSNPREARRGERDAPRGHHHPGKINEDGKQLPLDVKKGDRILIGKYAGTEIKIDEIEHLILREEEVLAVVEK